MAPGLKDQSAKFFDTSLPSLCHHGLVHCKEDFCVTTTCSISSTDEWTTAELTDMTADPPAHPSSSAIPHAKSYLAGSTQRSLYHHLQRSGLDHSRNCWAARASGAEVLRHTQVWHACMTKPSSHAIEATLKVMHNTCCALFLHRAPTYLFQVTSPSRSLPSISSRLPSQQVRQVSDAMHRTFPRPCSVFNSSPPLQLCNATTRSG